jgi:hypothetical protein
VRLLHTMACAPSSNRHSPRRVLAPAQLTIAEADERAPEARFARMCLTRSQLSYNLTRPPTVTLVKRWIAALALLSSCVWTTRRPSPVTPADRLDILAAAGDSLLATIPDRGLFTADVTTADALGRAARRLARNLAPSPGGAWCRERTGAARPVGVTVALAVDRVIGDRAQVRWSATCLMIPPGATTPAAFGEAGVYELIRRKGRWRVTRTLSLMAL